MSLAGVGFAFFLTLAFVLHWVLPRRAWIQNLVLLLASAVFYVTWDARLLGLLAASIVLDWVFAQLVARSAGSARQTWLTLAIVIDVAILGVFKYLGFFTDSLNALLGGVGVGSSLGVLQLALPLGISYTTLIRIGYLLEVHYERVEAEKSLLRFAVFNGFFAHLIAGPIVRAGRMLPQYALPRHLSAQTMREAAAALLSGFVLKAYISEVVGQAFVTPVFADPASYTALAHWVGLVGYMLQLFSDFAGYSLLAIGVGRLFGLALPENFRTPYLSTGMMEFWRRWHITLNTWLFDYLFGTWTTGRGWMRGRLSVGFVAVFLISGLWHGAAWTFVLWGLLHGIALVVQHRWDLFYKGLCRKDRIWVKRRKSRAYSLAGWAITQSFFLFTLLPFRAPSMDFAIAYLRGMVVDRGTLTPNLVSLNLVVCLGLLVVWHLKEIGPGPRIRARLAALPDPVWGLVFGFAIVFLALFVPVGAGTFIYANF